MNLNMTGKRVLVTGSTSGIGIGIAESFIKEGANVIINSYLESEVKSALHELQSKYPNSIIDGIVADLSIEDDCNRLYEQACANGNLDVLVNNIGIYPITPFSDITDEEWNHIWNINVMTAVRMCRNTLPKMLKENKGVIINISSEAGLRPNPDLVHYSVTKAALIGLSRALAELTKGTEVRVNSVLPVTTWTPGIKKYFEDIAKQESCTLETAIEGYFKTGNDKDSLIQKFVTIEQVANTVLFVAGNDGINGNSVLIDGGVIKHI